MDLMCGWSPRLLFSFHRSMEFLWLEGMQEAPTAVSIPGDEGSSWRGNSLIQTSSQALVHTANSQAVRGPKWARAVPTAGALSSSHTHKRQFFISFWVCRGLPDFYWRSCRFRQFTTTGTLAALPIKQIGPHLAACSGSGRVPRRRLQWHLQWLETPQLWRRWQWSGKPTPTITDRHQSVRFCIRKPLLTNLFFLSLSNSTRTQLATAAVSIFWPGWKK